MYTGTDEVNASITGDKYVSAWWAFPSHMESRAIFNKGAFKKVNSYIRDRKLTIGKFLMVGGSAVALNLFLLFLMVRYLGFSSPLGENLANALAMELSIIYNFFMSRKFTWRDRPKKSGKRLCLQILGFHITIGATILLRIVLFWWLQKLGVFYILNAAIGIGLAATFDFIVYDTLIFKKGG